MIYLIRTKYEKVSLLKIGYTEDSKKKSRYTAYRLHNPLFEVLYEIPNGTEDDEKLLQVYFAEYQYKGYGKEWFYESQEIINYFESHRTLESLSDLRSSGVVIDKTEFYQFRDFVKRIINSVVNKKVKAGEISMDEGVRQIDSLVEDILTVQHIRSHTRLWKYIEKTFNYKESDLVDQIYSKPVQEFLSKFNSCSRFTDKMKLLCDADFAEGELSAVLDSIPITFKNYYLTLGPKKIRNLQYKNSVLLSEYEKIKNNQDNSNQLLEKLYRDFSIKSRYTRVEIKEKLGKLYNECNIHLSPKASDLERYFNIKEVLIPDSSGKKSRGYELISKKE